MPPNELDERLAFWARVAWIVAGMFAVVAFLHWLVGKLVFLALAWLSLSSVGSILAADRKRMRRTRH